MTTNAKVVTVFNGRLEKATRRMMFIPTMIHDAHYVEAKGAIVANNGVWSDNVQFKIRIPITSKVQDERIYIPELMYKRMDEEEAAKHWTIRKGDIVIKGEYDGEQAILYEDEIMKYAEEKGIDLIHVTEYADGTDGGSIYTKHWRIGGKG